MARKRLTPSLRTRQFGAALLALIAFLGLTGYSLDQAFRETAKASLEQRLHDYVRAYIAGTDITREGRLLLPQLPPEPRFQQPGSGLYATLITPNEQWQSPSSLGHQEPWGAPLQVDEFVFEEPNAEHPSQFRFGRGVLWVLSDGTSVPVSIYVAEDKARIDQQIGVFRRALWIYLVTAGILLLLVMTFVMTWSLWPLKKVRRDLRAIEQGQKDEMGDRYPAEVMPLTRSINELIKTERQHLDRYQRTLADLAHSLKTPLAVLGAALEADDPELLKHDVATQVERMDEIVAYQLSRAATAGKQVFSAPIAIQPHAENIVQGLEKIYASKNILCEFDIVDDALFYGEEGDLMEIIGNLLENAFKWANHRVLLSIETIPSPSDRRKGLIIKVEDDGPGIAEEDIPKVLQRGVRIDERVHGHGIGMSIVQQIIQAFDGELEVMRSPELGGALFQITIQPDD